jgi:hypothetical protein
VELSLFGNVFGIGHGDVELGFAEVRIVCVEGLVPVVKQVAFRVVQSWVCVVVDFAIPERSENNNGSDYLRVSIFSSLILMQHAFFNLCE